MISFSQLLDSSESIERRLFAIALLLTVAVMTFWLIIGFFSGYDWPIMSIYAVAFLFYSLLFVLFSRGVSFKLLSGLYYSLGLLLIAVGWLPSGGIRGSVIHMFVLIFVSGLLVLTRKSYLTFLISGFVLVVFFSYQELADPNLAAPYNDTSQLIRDLVIANVLTISLVGFLLYFYKSEYQKDRVYIQGVNEELLLEKKRVEEANKSKSDFLATISHEMRTPLNGIIGITDLLSRSDMASEQKELISHLDHSSVLLRSLINDVLDLTQIESNQLVFAEESFSPKMQLLQLVNLCKLQVIQQKKEIEIQFDYDNSIPEELKGDIVRLKQILLNLLSNAIKFTEAGHIKVSASLKEAYEESIILGFSIEDTGIGISEADQKKLFNKFFKANVNTSVEGSGLGLVISKILTEKMGGSIAIESDLGAGTEFNVTLPFLTNDRKVLHKEIDQPKEYSFENLYVLIVEDVQVNRLVAEKMLNNLGINKIEIAVDGAEAVEKCLKHSYDIILMDIKMPVMTGLEATAKILNHCDVHGTRKPHIVALTANAFKEDIEASKEVGMNDFLSKPFNINELQKVISVALSTLDVDKPESSDDPTLNPADQHA